MVTNFIMLCIMAFHMMSAEACNTHKSQFVLLVMQKQVSDWRVVDIVVPLQKVQLDFSVFDTQENTDWVQIFDGDNSDATMIGRLSGSYTPAPTGFVTSQHHMFVRFTSSEQVSYRGWTATYTSVP